MGYFDAHAGYHGGRKRLEVVSVLRTRHSARDFTTHVISPKPIIMANVVKNLHYHAISPKLITMANAGEGHNGKNVYHSGMSVERQHEARHAYSLFVPGATVSKVLKVYAINSKHPILNNPFNLQREEVPLNGTPIHWSSSLRKQKTPGNRK